LSIEDKIPDHSALSRARNERSRYGDILRRVFERVVVACNGAGLVGGEGFAVDGNLIVADANKQRSIRAIARAIRQWLGAAPSQTLLLQSKRSNVHNFGSAHKELLQPSAALTVSSSRQFSALASSYHLRTRYGRYEVGGLQNFRAPQLATVGSCRSAVSSWLE
jgi:hypothetical protein